MTNRESSEHSTETMWQRHDKKEEMERFREFAEDVYEEGQIEFARKRLGELNDKKGK